MRKKREERLRGALLIGAVTAWAISATLTALVYTKVLDVLQGWGLVNQMLMALAITLTVVWAQLRVRRLLVDVFTSGMNAADYRRQEDDLL